MRINDILIKPHLTERALKGVESGFYAFQVRPSASKNQIKTAVEDLFEAKVSQVRTAIHKGKSRRVGKKMKPKQLSNQKIAYVKLKSGKISIFPQS